MTEDERATRDATIRGLLTGDPSTHASDKPGALLDGFTLPQFLPEADELRTLDTALDDYFAKQAANSETCGSVEARRRSRQGCNCKSCAIWRDKAAASRRRLRAAARQKPGRIKLSQFERRALRDLWRERGIDPRKCVYCGSRSQPQIEHFVPVHTGGTSHAYNLLPACWPCNSDKGVQPPWQWMLANCPAQIPIVMDFVRNVTRL